MDWLGELPKRIYVPYLSTDDRIEFAEMLSQQAYAASEGRRFHSKLAVTNTLDWYPLLRFTKGNPLVTSVVISNGLTKGYRTREEIAAYLHALRSGSDCVTDSGQDRHESLGASLRYGFDGVFGDEERYWLAALCFFQSMLDVDVLTAMGDCSNAWHAPGLVGLTRAAAVVLLDRCVD